MNAPLDASLRRIMLGSARAAAEKAYAPYSRFRVGAAVLGGSGAVYPGANVENASYGLSCCAERSAIFNAVALGEREIKAVLIYTPTAGVTTPCGACRQVIREFGPQATVLCLCDGPDTLETTVDQLLPASFTLQPPS